MKKNEYKTQVEASKTLLKKETNLNNVVRNDIPKYEIIKQLIVGLESEFVNLKKIVSVDFEVNDEAVEKAEKISKIAFALQSCLNVDKGEEIAVNLTWLYRFVRYSCKRIIDNEDLTYIKPAHLVARNLKEGWLNMPEESRQIN